MLHSLVSTRWLENNLEKPELVVLYTTLVPKKKNIPEEVKKLQIKGARFFDLDTVFCDQNSGLPNTFPSAEQFELGCRKLGINRNSKIVVYDSLGIYSSPRVWFLFKSMGHEDVFVLDGGFKAWLEDGRETENKSDKTYQWGNFSAKFNPDVLVSKDELAEQIGLNQSIIIDARSALRFSGEVAEPRKGLKSGHISGSCNLHYARLLHNGKYKSVKVLKTIFDEFKSDQPIVFSCGSGITACILILAASELLPNKLLLYDGSWTEWGSS